MTANRPYVISIAGFDPSGGAGLLADVKTFEQNLVYGFGVCSALTVQNDTEFLSVKWITTEEILAQLQALTKKFFISACKIGIFSSLDAVEEVVKELRNHNPAIKIIFDPVLKASAGYTFHSSFPAEKLKKLLQQITLITPNYPEQEDLEKMLAPDRLKAYCAVLLKGGHHPQKQGVDVLTERDSEIEIKPTTITAYQKHGSGCVLSAAITAQLAWGNSLALACTMAKTYTEGFLNSNESLLGYHKL